MDRPVNPLQAHFDMQRGNAILSPQEILQMVRETESGQFDDPKDEYAYKRATLLLLIHIATFVSAIFESVEEANG